MIYFSDFDVGGGGSMIELVGIASQAFTDGAATTMSINGTLTGGIDTSPSPGDCVVLVMAKYSAAADTGDMAFSGYTHVLTLESGGTHASRLGVLYKFMGGSPDTTVPVIASSGIFWGRCVAAVVLRGVDASTAIDVTSASASAVGGAQASPPAITPVTAGAFIVGCSANDATSSVVAYGNGNYTHFAAALSSDTGFGSLGVGVEPWNGSGPFDGTMTGGTAGANGGSVAMSVAFRPA